MRRPTGSGSPPSVPRTRPNSPRQAWCRLRTDSSPARSSDGSVNAVASASSVPRLSGARPSSAAKAGLANSKWPLPSAMATGSRELRTVARTPASWCSATSSRTALTCTMMSTSDVPMARPSASSAALQGSAVPRTISLQAANERRGDSVSGSSLTVGLAGSPAQVTVRSCSLRNHMR